MKELATKHGLKVHMDGARLFNAATALGVPLAQITQHVDSVTFSLSKVIIGTGVNVSILNVFTTPNIFPQLLQGLRYKADLE